MCVASFKKARSLVRSSSELHILALASYLAVLVAFNSRCSKTNQDFKQFLETQPSISAINMLITLSGIDGAGKSTQMARLQAHFQAHERVPVYLWTRGGYTSLCNVLKSMARRLARGTLPAPGPSEQRDQLFRKGWIQFLWLTIAILDLMRVYGIQVRWWLLRGRPVLCDRYLWDTLIDLKLAFPDIQVEEWLLWKILVSMTPRPDAAFLLTIPLEEAERRCQMKYEPFPDRPNVREHRLSLYQELARHGRLHVIDAARSVDLMTSEILGILRRVEAETI